MKIKQLLTKTLLVAVGLLAGQSVWGAVEITETYDFGGFITANNGTANLTTSGDGIAQSGSSEKKGTVKVIDNLTVGGNTLNLNGRFAVDYQYNAGAQIRFMWRKSNNAYQHGLAGQWNGNGTADSQGAARFSVLNLKAGDKITLTFAIQSGRDATPYTCSASQLTGIAADAKLTSGTQYTVAADGNVDLYFVNNNFAISKIVIVTYGTETVSAPTMSITGVNAKARKVTITAGTSDAGNDVTTYYTTDGSTPTTSSASFTTASQEITVGAGAESESTVTVKAFSVSSTSTASDVVSSDISVGTKVKLAAPNIKFSGFTLNGSIYNPTYSFTTDQSGVIGSPTPTLSYSFNGGDAKQGNSYKSVTAGTLMVTATAEGYDPNSTEMEIIGGNFTQSYTFDATTSVTVDTSVENVWGSGGNAQSVNGAGWSFASLSHCTYTLRSDMSLSNFAYARATTANTMQGFYVRGSSNGVINYILADGEYIMFETLNDKVLANSETKSQSFAQYANVRKIYVYSPATEVDLAIAYCKANEPSTEFETAIEAETFTTAAEVYAFHTAWQVDKASGNDLTKVIINADFGSGSVEPWTIYGDASSSATSDGDKYGIIESNGNGGYQYNTGWNGRNVSQNIYGLPAGGYRLTAKIYSWLGGAPVKLFANGALSAEENGDNHEPSLDFTVSGSEESVKVGVGGVGQGSGDNTWGTWGYRIDYFTLTKIESVSVTIANSGYSSLGSAYGLDFANATTSTNGAAALTAFAATESSETSVKLVSIDEAPAATGVILKGTPGATYTIPVKADAAALTVTNLLHAAVTATDIEANTSYIMQGGEFHLVTEASKVPAGKAYLQTATGGAKALTVVFADDLTGIANVNAAEAVQPVKRIVNGQLVIEKSGKRYNAAGAEF